MESDTRKTVLKIIELIVSPSCSDGQRQAAYHALEIKLKQLPLNTTLNDFLVEDDDLEEIERESTRRLKATLDHFKNGGIIADYQDTIKELQDAIRRLKLINGFLKRKLLVIQQDNMNLTAMNRSLWKQNRKLKENTDNQNIANDEVIGFSERQRWTLEEIVWIIDQHLVVNGKLSTLERNLNSKDIDIINQLREKFGVNRSGSAFRAKISEIRKGDISDPIVYEALTRKGWNGEF